MSVWNLGQNDPPEELTAMKNHMASKDSQIASYQTQLMRKADELDELKRSFEDAIHKLSHESNRALELERNLHQRDTDLTNEKNFRQNLEKALDTATKEHKAAELEIRSLQTILDTTSHDSRSQQDRMNQLQKERLTLQERVKELQAQVPQQQPPDSVKRNGTHRPRSSSLSNFRMTTLEQDLRETRATLQKREEELQAANAKLSTVRAEAIRVGNEKFSMEKTLGAKVRQLEASIQEKDEEIQAWTDQAGNNNREQELLERIDEDEAKIAALESMLKGTPQASRLEQKLRATEKQLEEERRNVAHVTELHSRLKEEKNNLLQELQGVHVNFEDTRPRQAGNISEYSSPSSSINRNPQAEVPPTPVEDVDLAAYISKLLAAIDRLRDERDNLQRDVQFLESESRFAIEALEAKLSASLATSVSTNETVGTLAQMKNEMDALHSELSETKVQARITISAKDEEIKRLEGMVLVLGTALSRQAGQAPVGLVTSQDSELGARLQEAEEKLEVTILCLEATTSQRDDLVEALREKEAASERDLEGIRAGQQQSTQTMQDLEKEVDDLTNQLEEMESHRNSLLVEIENLQNDAEANRNELAKAESRYSDLQFNQLNNMSSTEATVALRTKIHELEARILRRNEQLGIHQHDIRRMETNLRLQEDRLTEMTTEMEMLNAQKDAMVEDCASTREERDSALERVEELEDEIVNFEERQARDDEAIKVLIGVIVETVGKAKDAIDDHSRKAEGEAKTSIQKALSLVEELRREKVRMEMDIETYKQQIDEIDHQVSILRNAHETDVARNAALQEDLDQQGEQLQRDIENLQSEKEQLQIEHTTTTDVLKRELDELRNQLQDVASSQPIALPVDKGNSLERKFEDVTEQLVKSEKQTQTDLEALEVRLAEALESKDAVEKLLEDAQSQIISLEERHQAEMSQLRVSFDRQLESSKQTLTTLEALEREKAELDDKLNTAQVSLQTAEVAFEEQRKDLERHTKVQEAELKRALQHVEELSGEIRNRKEDQVQSEREHHAAHQASKGIIENGESKIRSLEDDVARLKDDLKELEAARFAAEREKAQVQEQATTLLATVEKSKSIQHVLQGQIDEREQAISALRLEVSRVQEDLSRVEQANAKASLNMNLTSAQHKREMADLQRELQTLRSKTNLDQVIAELDERNREMDELLKQKCAEIEANDDRALELLKENKKLSSKVDSLARKITTLQSKLASLKAQPKQGDVKSPQPPATMETTPVPQPAVQRPRSMTTTLSQPTFPATASSSKNVPRAAPLHMRPKTPERQTPPAPMPVFRNRTPEQILKDVLTPDPTSVVGKKRRAPDDFEAAATIPPQVFTAESIPGEEAESRTPRVRRMLSSLQSGFTPIRNAARPMISLSPSKKTPIRPSQSSPFISDVTNSPLVVPPLNSGLQSAKSKRSWLGKIRGASSSSTSSSQTSQGMSRMQ